MKFRYTKQEKMIIFHQGRNIVLTGGEILEDVAPSYWNVFDEIEPVKPVHTKIRRKKAVDNVSTDKTP